MTYTLTATIADLDALDLDVPQAAREAADLAGLARSATIVDMDPAASILAALTAGKIKPAGLAAAIRAAVNGSSAARAAHDVTRRVAAGIEADGTAALDAAHDDLIAAYRPRFDAAARVIVDAHAAGVRVDTDPGAAIRHGGAFAALYTSLADAAATMNAARTVITMHKSFGVGVEWFISAKDVTRVDKRPADFGHHGYTVVNDLDRAARAFENPGQLDGIHSRRVIAPAAQWLALIEAGHTPRLNTRTEADAVLAKAASLDAQATAAA